ncbi:MAG: phosphatidylinositol-specific phospholipase C1-like protein [Actinobacteria bacterium]|nr:phosphatidylinositol-specific phospholipase C1-like protein [Actinomycetota bacterium]
MLALVGSACSGSDDGAAEPAATTTTTTAPPTGVEALRLNQIQVIGSHNSYKLKPRAELSSALDGLVPSLAAEIEYGHLPLAEQLADHGIRQLEIDVVADPDGGLYATPAALEILGIEEEPDPAMLEPGFKVQHIQDVDFETTCPTFTMCLSQIEAWSSANPNHLPVMVMVETKSDSLAEGAEGLDFELPDLGVEFVDPPDMTPELFDDLEAEVRSVFDDDELITPDDVRGDAETLEAAVLDRGWPTLAESRGKVLFSLVDTGESKDVYTADAPSLEGKLFFTSGTPGEPDAAFVRVDDSTTDGADLQRFAEAGYLIRTRTDSPGIHAPANDTSWRDSALASGANYLSTDYYVPDPTLGTGYVVELPGGAVARCNPVTAPPDCDDADLASDT